MTSLPALLRAFEWLYVSQSVVGIALCLYSCWDAYLDLAAALGEDFEALNRLIVAQSYAVAGSLGILHVLLFWLGWQALTGPLPPPARQPTSLRIVVSFVVAQLVAIALQAWVVQLRRKVRTDKGGGSLIPTVAVVNQSTALTDEQVRACLPDFQTQVARDFAPRWGTGCHLVWVPRTETPPADAWQLVLLDDSDQAGTLGYHQTTPGGLPLAKVFVKTTTAADDSWSVVFSHELLEMLANPLLDNCVFLDNGQGGGWLLPVEVGDPVEGDQFAYTVGKTLCTDFVLPAWFSAGSAGPWDHRHHLPQSLYVLSGCYCSLAPVTLPDGWQQVFGDLSKGGAPKLGGPVTGRS